METTHHRTSPSAARVPYAARLMFKLLDKLRGGALTVHGPEGFCRTFGRRDDGPHVRITLGDWGVIGRAAASGDIGFAQTYVEGRWTSDNLAGLIALFCANRAVIEQALYGSRLGGLIYRVKHLFNANTRRGSRKNIAAHYDLGNAFYRLWLDPGMTYSSALFAGDYRLDLEQAQLRKYRRTLDQLGLVPGQRILELGCGWGGLAEVAAREYGVHVTALTLSKEQLAYARDRMQKAGLASQADLRLMDYRDLDGQYDHIVSIEMFEAVGEAYWDGYFGCLKRSLKPEGRAVVQSITIDEALFPRYRKGTDFIQQYVFPGGMLPSPTEFSRRAALAGLAVKVGVRFGPDYAETLRRWRVSFLAALPAARAQGYEERFLRLWEFYLAYCEGAFAAASTDVVQFDLAHI
jgi:cyclopropane-fatty-acyl-phospholipid synthase